MELTVSAVRCSLQVALLGAVTPNLRAVIANIDSKDSLSIYFYYEDQFSAEEEELSDIVETEVISDFPNFITTSTRIILPINEGIPSMGLWVYHRHEDVIHED